ncbi:MAG: M48 family metallopeptidase [Campylobacterales bacterium]
MRFIAPILMVFILSGCMVSQTPYTDRSRMMLISQDQEVKLGESAKNKILQDVKLSNDKQKKASVQEVGERIAKASGMEYDWEFFLIEDDSVNAFALPGGKVFVNTGLFKVAKSDDDLAVVVGHEIAHVIARHGAERMSMQQAASVGGQIVGALVGTQLGSSQMALFNQAYGIGMNYGVMLPYSRTQEYEADEIGLILMSKAGYDPEAAVGFWQNMMNSKEKKGVPEFLSTHPADKNRIESIKSSLEYAKSYKGKD